MPVASVVLKHLMGVLSLPLSPRKLGPDLSHVSALVPRRWRESLASSSSYLRDKLLLLFLLPPVNSSVPPTKSSSVPQPIASSFLHSPRGTWSARQSPSFSLLAHLPHLSGTSSPTNEGGAYCVDSSIPGRPVLWPAATSHFCHPLCCPSSVCPSILHNELSVSASCRQPLFTVSQAQSQHLCN